MKYSELIETLKGVYPQLDSGELRMALNSGGYTAEASFSLNDTVSEGFEDIARSCCDQYFSAKTSLSASESKLISWEEAARTAKDTSARKKKIVLVGFPKSGKSTYLYVLGNSDHYGIHWGSWKMGSRSNAFARWVDQQTRERAENDLPVNKTTDDQFSPMQLFSLENAVSSHEIESLDASGETIEMAFGYPQESLLDGQLIKNINEIRKSVAEAGGIIVLVDVSLASDGKQEGADLKNFDNRWTSVLEALATIDKTMYHRGFLFFAEMMFYKIRYIRYLVERALYDLLLIVAPPKDLPDESMGQDNSTPYQSIVSMLARHTESPPVCPPVRRPIAVVINKADLFNQQLGLDRIRKVARQSGQYRQVRDVTSFGRQREARSFIRKRFFSLYNSVRHRVKHRRFFAVSPLGDQPKIVDGSEKIYWNSITPILVEEPFLWLIKKIERRHKLSSARRIAVMVLVALTMLSAFWAAAHNFDTIRDWVNDTLTVPPVQETAVKPGSSQKSVPTLEPVAPTTSSRMLAPLIPANAESSKEEIRSTLMKWKEANQRLDVEQYVSFFAPHIEQYFRAKNVTPQFVRNNFQRAVDTFASCTITIDTIAISVHSDREASCTFRKDFSGRRKSGGRYECSVDTRLKFQKIGNEWKISLLEETKVHRVNNVR